MYAYKDVGGRAASGTAAEVVEPRREQAAEESRRGEAGMFNGRQVLQGPDCVACGHSRKAGMTCFNHWIPAFAEMTAGVARDLHRTGAPSFLFPSQYTFED